MDFAPYQNDEPAVERAKSPPLRSPPTSPRLAGISANRYTQRSASSTVDQDDPWAAARNQRLPSPSQYIDDEENEGGYTDLGDSAARRPHHYNDYIGQSALEGGGVTGVSVFATSLGIPLRIEACLAYLLLPPAGGVVLLLFEHQSDYVRFHAWQSALLFSALFLLHIIFTWTKVVSYMLLACDLLLIAYLTAGAWRNADILDRVELPFFGRLASGFVDDE